ncbi:MAG: peptide deformylase [Alphaproteobacteria bacterium]|nr:peptide deformylase [Alphaproteobacteria bacterium]
MAICEIVIFPDARLRSVSEPVDCIDDEIHLLIRKMLNSMYAVAGVGLAAIQIGFPKRIFIMDLKDEGTEPQFTCLINPELVSVSEEMSTYEEGCLSLPDFFAKVDRPACCVVRFLDERGIERSLDCDGLMATVVQHELDHLNGVLFIDHLSKLKRDNITKKFTKLMKRKGAV